MILLKFFFICVIKFARYLQQFSGFPPLCTYVSSDNKTIQLDILTELLLQNNTMLNTNNKSR
jgi:hypothetical protein